ncbi:MAG: hypothetical protein JWO53_1136 [Chlamydiia bacterium]|nr:hypothetical protein [Chlamydiia bacterium]
MDKIAGLDSSYEQFMNHLPELIPDGVLEVDLPLLQKLGLLNDDGTASSGQSLTRYFHVVEAKEKITLFNDQFVIWVVPEKIEEEPTTLVLIAMNNESKLKLELAFVTSGIYNTSRLVLRIIEKLLSEIQENEDLIFHFEHHSQAKSDE